MNRPRLLVAVVGTGTEIGKTWVTAAVAVHLRADGVGVVARKPVQSFDPGERAPTDAEVLAAATDDHPNDVCPPEWTFPVAMAPPMAAGVLGRPEPTMDELVSALRWPANDVDVGLVETVGGLRSPVASDGDSLSLVRRLDPDLTVLVAHAGLGTINDVRLAAGRLSPLATVVLLNRYDPDDDLHRRNLAWLVDRDQLDIVTSVDQLAHRIGAGA